MEWKDEEIQDNWKIISLVQMTAKLCDEYEMLLAVMVLLNLLIDYCGPGSVLSLLHTQGLHKIRGNEIKS